MDLVFSDSKVYEYILDSDSTCKVEPTVRAYWDRNHKISYVHIYLENEATEWLNGCQLKKRLKDLLKGQKTLEFQYSSADAIRRAIELFDVYSQEVGDSVLRTILCFQRDDEKLVELIE